MVWLLFAAVILLMAAVAVLLVKIYYLRRSAHDIAVAFTEHLSADTNTLIDISGRDKYMRGLAAAINDQLRLLRRQRQQYLNGDRELKEAVTNISHDLRTPLTAISGYLDMLDNEQKSESVTRYLGYIQNRTEALKQLTEELFRYSVILSVDKDMQTEPVNIKYVLEESIISFYAALTERGITPQVTIPEQPIVRILDKSSLSRVFSNILNNVLKYSDGDLKIIMTENGEISFINTAAKLDEVQVGKLFDRFFTVEAARNSTGLGLAISKKLVEQMNGTITAKYRDRKLSITICFAAC